MNISLENNPAYTLSTDTEKIDFATVHNYLSKHAYWSLNIPGETLKTAIKNSLNFGIFFNGTQVGYARVITDYATIAYLGDVFILPEHRGKALSKWLMETMTKHPQLQGLRRWILLTRDAHELYKKYGWKEIAVPARWMEKHDPNVYL